MRLFLLLTICLFCFISCKDDVYIPKPRLYPRLILPEKRYAEFNTPYCPFTFQMPMYSMIEKDTLYFDEKPIDECWFNLEMISLRASIHCSYYPLENEEGLTKLVKDAFKLANRHHVRANYVDEIPFRKSPSVSGMVFNIEGPAASPFQFYLTDSAKHFIRGALYFNGQSIPDSLAPLKNFIEEDIMRMLESFEWKK